MSISRKQFFKQASLASISMAGVLSAYCEESDSVPINSSLILPRSISWNSTIGLIAPASPIYDSSQFDEMIYTLKELGFNLVLGKHVRNRNGYLAGTDQERASDLMAMFKDDNIDAILCIRGGWGCNRILPLLDYEVIKANPKPLIGFSDITSLHMAIYKHTGLVTFHGPVGKSDWNTFTKLSFQSVVIDGKKSIYNLPPNQNDFFTITPGKAEGKLLGGNLSVLVAMIGSDYLPDFSDSILFLEDVGEDVYRIDRMITQLKLSGILDQLSGFIFGKCTNCDAGSNSLSLDQVLNDHIAPLKIPAFYGAMISHEDLNVTIPVGIRATMDASLGVYSTLEEAVR